MVLNITELFSWCSINWLVIKFEVYWIISLALGQNSSQSKIAFIWFKLPKSLTYIAIHPPPTLPRVSRHSGIALTQLARKLRVQLWIYPWIQHFLRSTRILASRADMAWDVLVLCPHKSHEFKSSSPILHVFVLHSMFDSIAGKMLTWFHHTSWGFAAAAGLSPLKRLGTGGWCSHLPTEMSPLLMCELQPDRNTWCQVCSKMYINTIIGMIGAVWCLPDKNDSFFVFSAAVQLGTKKWPKCAELADNVGRSAPDSRTCCWQVTFTKIPKSPMRRTICQLGWNLKWQWHGIQLIAQALEAGTCLIPSAVLTSLPRLSQLFDNQ